jgi:hypothetical protein
MMMMMIIIIIIIIIIINARLATVVCRHILIVFAFVCEGELV